MVQDQLVEYIRSQLKAGVSVDAVRAALVGAGWQPVDVDDTMKKVQSGAGPAAPASVAVSASQPKAVTASSSTPSSAPASTPVSSGPQVIRVSDLVSSSSMGASMMSGAKTDSVISKISAGTSKTSSSVAGSGTASSGASPVSPVKIKKSRAGLTEGVLGILLIVCAAAAIFFFFENKGLSDQITSLNSQSGGVASQLSALQAQMNATTTALEGQVASMQAANSELALELSFYVVPPDATSTTGFASALGGTVSGGGAKAYTIMTTDGAKVSVANSKDARVVALLQPLVGSTTTSQFAGNYTYGVPSITLTAVNGTSVTAPVATSTASTTTEAPMMPATTTGQ